jgi:UDP-galactopyranose mutase
MKYDYLIIGAGFFGSICAYELTKQGYKCLILEKRDHIGGNCYTEKTNNINIHKYGAHIFHTSNKKVWDYINELSEFNNYKHHVLANYKNEIYSLPFNMFTFNKLWGVNTPEEAKKIITKQSSKVLEPSNLEEQAIKLVGTDVYKKLIKGYTEKQWMKPSNLLPKEIIKRLPVRFTYDNNYFYDTYQGVPIDGYTKIFEKLLKNIEVKLEVDYLKDKKYWNHQAKKIIYTGPIDAFYDYQFGELEYKTVRFDHKRIETDNYQGTSVINYTDDKIPFTRTIEHKHFENSDSNVTWVTWEYPTEYKAKETEPYYPVNDQENNLKYSQYKNLADNEKNIIFGGRLAEYKYYDMHQVIESALNFIKREINDNTNNNTSITS